MTGSLLKRTNERVPSPYLSIFMMFRRYAVALNQIRVGDIFLVGVQPLRLETTLFGVPFPLPTPQGRRAQQLKTRPECSRAARGIHSGHRGNFGKPIQEGVPRDAAKPEGHAAPPHKGDTLGRLI